MYVRHNITTLRWRCEESGEGWGKGRERGRNKKSGKRERRLKMNKRNTGKI